MITLWCSYQKLQNVEHCYVQYHSKQFYRDMGCQRVIMCRPIKKLMFHNTSFLSYFHWQKSVCDYCVWYDKYLGRIYQKLKILTLVHVFAHNSKSILPQSASFSHAETQMWKFHFSVLKWTLVTFTNVRLVCVGFFIYLFFDEREENNTLYSSMKKIMKNTAKKTLDRCKNRIK